MKIFGLRKTYWVVIVGIAYAGSAWYLGEIGQKEAFEIILGALGLGTLRAGVSKSGFKGGD